jgi:alpha-glucosidase
MVGEALLVAPVYEPNVTHRSVYLPKTFNWYHQQTGDYYPGGQDISIEAPIDAEGAPAFVREMSIIPMGKSMQHVGHSPDDLRVVEIWPSQATSGTTEYKKVIVEDDGVSTKHTDAQAFTEIEVSVQCTEKIITVDVNVLHDKFTPEYKTLWFTSCAANDKRDLVWAQEGKSMSVSKVDQKNRKMIGIDMPWKK